MDTQAQLLTQESPYPQALADLVERLTFKPGWRFVLTHMDRGQGSKGLTLDIVVTGPNSYSPDELIQVHHFMIVPAASFDERAWMRWLFDQCLLVETHEACEFFKIDSVRPYGPHHEPGHNPYTIHEVGSFEETLKNHRGDIVH